MPGLEIPNISLVAFQENGSFGHDGIARLVRNGWADMEAGLVRSSNQVALLRIRNFGFAPLFGNPGESSSTAIIFPVYFAPFVRQFYTLHRRTKGQLRVMGACWTHMQNVRLPLDSGVKRCSFSNPSR